MGHTMAALRALKSSLLVAAAGGTGAEIRPNYSCRLRREDGQGGVPLHVRAAAPQHTRDQAREDVAVSPPEPRFSLGSIAMHRYLKLPVSNGRRFPRVPCTRLSGTCTDG